MFTSAISPTRLGLCRIVIFAETVLSLEKQRMETELLSFVAKTALPAMSRGRDSLTPLIYADASIRWTIGNTRLRPTNRTMALWSLFKAGRHGRSEALIVSPLREPFAAIASLWGCDDCNHGWRCLDNRFRNTGGVHCPGLGT